MSNNYQETSLTHVFPRTMPRRPRRPIKGYPSFGDVVKNKPVFPMVKQPNGQKEEKTNNSIPKQPNNKLDKTKDNNKNLKKKNSESLFSNPVFYIVSGVLTLGLLVVIVLIIKRKKKSEDLS